MTYARLRRLSAATITAATLACATAPPASAQNWPQFRGPNASGIGAGSPPTTWNVETGASVRWNVPVEGLAHSSPIVWGDRIYLTTAVSQSEAQRDVQTGWLGGTGASPNEDEPWNWKVLCLSLADGKLLWEQTAHSGVPKIKRHIKATHANSTPATDGKHVVAYFGSEGLYCYDRDGKLVWTKDLGVMQAGPYDAPGLEWGVAASPIIHDGKVIVQCDARNASFWVALDIQSGEEVLRVKRDDVTTWSTPNVLEHDGRTQLVVNGYKHMGGYDLKTGEELWKISGGGDIPVPTPLVSDDLIVVTNSHARTHTYVVSPEAKGDITPDYDADRGGTPAGIVWWRPKVGSYMPTPLIYDGRLYIANDNGILEVGELRSGNPVYRQRLGESRGTYSASPVAADGRLYITNEDGDVYVVKAGAEYEQLAHNEMNEVCMATPAIADGKLLIRTKTQLYCIAK